jgi:phage protein U
MSDNSFSMMALGGYRFSLSTAAYQDLERTSSWRWPSADRVGARAVPQYVGPGEDTISMRGTIYPHFRGGLGQLSAMRAEASQGAPLLLVDGSGRVWGKFVITEIREGQTVFFSNGKPRRIDFDISLTMYDDAPASAQPVLDAPVSGIGSGAGARGSEAMRLISRATGNAGPFDSQTIHDRLGI